ncbi:MAG: hypothetical protein AAF559_04755 [Pseudomonadota bacterium]
MTKRTVFAGLLVAMAALSSVPALARPFPVYATTTPILFRYAACLYDGSAPTVEAQVEQCAALKAELTIEGEAVIERFHVVERYDVERNLRRAFREMELDLKKIRSKGKFVPQAMVGYWKCMGEAAMVTEDYLAADAVNYLGIEEPCFEATIAPARKVISDSESTSLTLLYRRFRRNGRLTFPAARQTAQNGPGGTRLQFVETLDPGFLVPGQLTQVDEDGARE